MRGRLVQGSAAIVVAALSWLTIGFWWVLHSRLEANLDVVLRQRADAVAALAVVEKGRLTLAETSGDDALETGFWLFDTDGRLVASPPHEPRAQSVARMLGTAGLGRRDVDGLRLAAFPIRDGNTLIGTSVVVESLGTIRNSERVALSGALALDAIVLVGTIALTRFNANRVLAPVAAMTTSARAWSDTDLDRRFDLGPPRDELTALAATLDEFLERLGRAMRAEQRLTAEIAHELRTPLARMRSTAEFATAYGDGDDRRQALDEVVRETDRLSLIIDTLLTGHGPAAGTCDIGAIVGREAESVRLRHDAVQVSVTTDGAQAACEPALASRIVAPLLGNATRHANSAVRVEIVREGGFVHVLIRDDGEGFLAHELTHVFTPGFRGERATGVGNGLGLPLARRLARAAGGEISVVAGPGGGVRLRLPAGLA